MKRRKKDLNGEGELSDLELIKRVTAGDEESFAILVHRYHRPITNLIFRAVGNFDTALDLSQEVFLKVYRALDRYNPEYKFSTWLYRVAMNAAIDYHRKREVVTVSLDNQSESGSNFEWQMPSDAPSPEQQVYSLEAAQHVAEMVARLPREYRELVTLRYTNDMSYSDIAKKTGMPLGTVKNRLFRAHQILRDYLADSALAA